MKTTYSYKKDLNPHRTFDNFVVGISNSKAHAAAWAVAENPGALNKLLIICGDVGLGKTHLLHAIGNELLIRNPQANICYCPTHIFVDSMYAASRMNRIDEFHSFYRNLDLFLLDTVQFIADKEAVQEELLFIIRELSNAGKQVVVGMNKPPQELSGLKRLCPCFSQGFLTTIAPPDAATRLALVKHFADRHNVNISQDMFQFLAARIDAQCIRQLEGYIIRLGAYAHFQNLPVTMDMTLECLKSGLIPV